MLRVVSALALLAVLAAADVSAQTLDRTLTWRTYAAERSARVRVFPCPDERRPQTVVIDDVASNVGAVTEEAGYVADLVGREAGFDPTEATFVFRYTPASFTEGAPDEGKTLLLRATFRRTTGGTLGAPQWRLITADELDDLTDRAFR